MEEVQRAGSEEQEEQDQGGEQQETAQLAATLAGEGFGALLGVGWWAIQQQIPPFQPPTSSCLNYVGPSALEFVVN
jgi:hypothetical protein